MRKHLGMVTVILALCYLTGCYPEGAVDDLEGETRDSLSSRQMWQVRLARLAFRSPLTAEQCGGSLKSYWVELDVPHITSNYWLGPFGCANQLEDTSPGEKVFIKAYKHSAPEREIVKAYRPTVFRKDFSLDDGQRLKMWVPEGRDMTRLAGECKISLKPGDLPDPEAGQSRNEVTVPCKQFPAFSWTPNLLVDPGNLASVVLAVEVEPAHGSDR
jgi:hypothetical protein